MNEDGLYDWADFRERLVEEIVANEARGGHLIYYERWMRALERLALARGFITSVELDVRTAEYVSDGRDEEEDLWPDPD